MNVLDIERIALWWGPGILVLIMFGYGFLRLAHYWIEKSMEVKRQQLDSAYDLVRHYIEQFLGAQSAQADALSRLANSVEHRESQESFEHQEMLIALKALHRDMNGLRCRSDEGTCAVRPAGVLAGRFNSSCDSRRDSRSRAFDSCCGRPEAESRDGAGVESQNTRCGAAETSAMCAPLQRPDSK